MPDNYPGGRPEDPIDELRAMWEQFRRRYDNGSGGGGGNDLQFPIPWWVLPIVLVLGLGYASYYEVAPDERAVVLRFGKVSREVGPGPHLKFPWPIEEAYKVSVTQIRKEEFGFRSVRGGSRDQPTEAYMLTGDKNIVKLQFIVQYRVKPTESGTQDFLFHVRDQRSTVRNAAEAAMREVIGGKSIDDALTQGKDEIQEETQTSLQEILDMYEAGIEVMTVKLMNVDPPDDVEDAFKDVINAQQDKERAINKASGYANAVIPTARGEAAQLLNQAEAYKAAKVEEATGAASRFDALFREYGKAKQVTRQRLYLETLEEVLPNVNKVLIDQSVGSGVLPYLPLDQVRRGATPVGPPAPTAEEGSN